VKTRAGDLRIIDIGSSWRWVVSFKSRPPYPRSTHWIGGMGHRTGRNDVERRQILLLPGCKLRLHGHPARSQSLYLLPWLGSHIFFFFGLYSPIQALAASMKLSVPLQLLDLGQSVGLLGRAISSCTQTAQTRTLIYSTEIKITRILNSLVSETESEVSWNYISL
jgi:hypothetical protein